MKKILFVLLFVSAQAVWSQEAKQSYIEQFSQLAADKIKEMHPVGIFKLNKSPSASLYWATWKFHANKNPKLRYASVGIGGEWAENIRGGDVYLAGAVNVVAISGAFWDFDWARAHVERTVLPAIDIGPMLMIYPDKDRFVETFSSFQGFLDSAGLMVGVRF